MDTSSTNLAVSYDGYYSSDGVTAYIYGTDSYYVDLTREQYGTAVNIDATNSTGEHDLFGDEAANVIISGPGSSRLWGGVDNANDILVGGWGYDTFYYGKYYGSDTILNATPIDTVDLYNAVTSDIVSTTYDGTTLGLYFDTGNAVFVAYSGDISPTFTTYDGNLFAFNGATRSWEYPSKTPKEAATAVAISQQIDWNNVPHFDNYTALVNYLDDCKYNLQTTVPVVCVGFVPNDGQVPITRLMNDFDFTEYGGDGQSTCLLCEITNYAGERVAYAYTHGDTSFLTADELQLYNLGVQIVNETKSLSTDPLYQEIHIHDEISGRADYYSDDYNGTKVMRYQSALGALIDGQANCQGYTDAFYMLGTMCGFDVDKVVGYAGGGHAWNTITFGDKSYFVDVTWDDDYYNFDGTKCNNYIYFNAPTSVMGADHSWSPYCVPQNMQVFPDELNFYFAPEYGESGGSYFGTTLPTAEEALNHIAYRIVNLNFRGSWVAAPFDYYYSIRQYSADYLTAALNNMGYDWSGSVYLQIASLGNYMYYTVANL